MAALPQEGEDYVPRPQLHLVEDVGRREQTCPVCEEPFHPFYSNGVSRRTCSRTCGQRLRRREELERNNGVPLARPRRSAPNIDRGAREIIRRMSKEDRHEYHVEGCLPLLESVASTGWVDEDTDPDLVPTGCASCWLTGGRACINCPSPIGEREAARRRKEHQRVLASTT